METGRFIMNLQRECWGSGYTTFFFYTACFCERRDETERHKERELLFVCHVYSISILHIVEHELMQGKISLDTPFNVITMHDLCNF
jgi:hypothetical protein